MNFRLRVTVLSPLHIGTGDVLLKDFDFVVNRGRTWVLDQDAILAAEYDAEAGQLNWRRLSLPAGQLVDPKDLHEGSPFVRYSLEGTTSIEQIREQIKDPFGRCYLPGSSLKGALRTALMWEALRSGTFRPDINRLNPQDRQWAAQAWERQVFGPDPNHDLLRALVVADSEPLPLQPSPLMLLNVRVFSAGPPGAPIVVEAIRRDTVFHTTIHVDEYCFSAAAQALGFARHKDWLQKLPQIAQEYSRARIQIERDFAAQHSLSVARQFYDELASCRLPPNAFLLQIAWGVGWTGKSIGPWLSQEQQNHIRRLYQLGRPPRAGRNWQPDLRRPFPKSRRLRSVNNRDAHLPLGWVLVEMQEVKG